MKHAIWIGALVLVGLIVLLSGCAGETNSSAKEGVLQVTDGSKSKSYTLEDLQKLPASEATFGDTAYQGVQLSVLLEEAGFNPADIKIVKVTALDGFTVNYEAELFTKDDTLVAYQLATGEPLGEDDKPFRMVLPGQEGKLNPRQLKEIRIFK
jgi:DMSO/TMAO reductase YedYZ molybdopterin-dependent catalytic subunit